jgi:hypothetical protein
MSSSPADEQEATFLLDVPPQWMRDDEAASCAKCNSMFSLFTRRHHCRSCGKLFCADCTKQEVELPSFYMLSGPQRVCVDCAPALLELTTKASELEMTAKFYLRGISDQFVETCAEVGWRPVFEKAFYLTKRATGETRVLEMIDASKTALPLDSDKKRLVFNELIAHLKHPFLYDASTDVVDYFRDKDQLMVLSTLCRLGSVRDRIYDVAAPMRQRYAAKYGPSASARALSQKHCAYIGRHVLEALRFLVEHNIVPLSLHSGNVMVASEKPIRAFVCASALVHALAAGRAPRDALTLVGVDCTNADAVAVSRFGHLLFECAAGFEKGSMPLHRWKCSKTMRPVFDILVTIFPSETCLMWFNFVLICLRFLCS